MIILVYSLKLFKEKEITIIFIFIITFDLILGVEHIQHLNWELVRMF